MKHGRKKNPNTSLLLSFETIPGLREAVSGYAGWLNANTEPSAAQA
jgi:hypothetical protein